MGIVRKTKSLELVLNEFQILTTAISVIELIKKLNSKLNKTTIYRILEKLEDDGILHSFLGNNGTKWYAKCRNCSKFATEKCRQKILCPVFKAWDEVF